MKRIEYSFNISINKGTEELPVWEDCLFPKSLPYSQTAEEIAKAEAYNGKYEIVDDGQPDPADTPSQLDAIEAQVTYTAMMTDTLLEV